MLHVFIQWLAHKGALNNWLNNIITADLLDTYTLLVQDNDIGIDHFLVNMPDWFSTEEGYPYWSDLHDSWQGVCNRLAKQPELLKQEIVFSPPYIDMPF